MLLCLNELLLERFKEEAVMTGEILSKLLLFVHGRKASKVFIGYICTGDLHGNLVVRLLHLCHIDQLTKEVFVEIEHVRSLPAGAGLDLLMVQEEHLMDVAWLVRGAILCLIVSITINDFC